MSESFEQWKVRNEEYYQEFLGIRNFNRKVLTRLTHGAASCCGLHAGWSEYPKGVQLVVTDTPLEKVSASSLVKFDKYQLESGKWLNMQFFSPETLDDWDEEYVQDSYPKDSPSEDVYCLSISYLKSATHYSKNGYTANHYRSPYDFRGISHKFKIDFDPIEELKTRKDKEIIIVSRVNDSYYDNWMEETGTEDLFEVKYEHRFHNRPYSPEDGYELNYLQLKILKVK